MVDAYGSMLQVRVALVNRAAEAVNPRAWLAALTAARHECYNHARIRPVALCGAGAAIREWSRWRRGRRTEAVLRPATVGHPEDQRHGQLQQHRVAGVQRTVPTRRGGGDVVPRLLHVGAADGRRWSRWASAS